MLANVCESVMSQAISTGALAIEHEILYKITETMAKASKDNDKVCMYVSMQLFVHTIQGSFKRCSSFGKYRTRHHTTND